MEINELIRELRHRGLHNGSTLGHHGGIYEVAADAMETQQKRIAELEEQRRWIPAKENPPGLEQYLCVVIRPIPGGSYVRELRVLWNDYNNCWNCEDLIVTHCMPLPELPKEESE